MKSKKAVCIVSAFFAVAMAIGVLCLFICRVKTNDYSELPILFIGIGQLLIITGLLVMAILMFWQVGIITKGQIEFEKKQAEWKHSTQCMEKMKEEAEIRQKEVRERDRINDLFRLIEFAKDKKEEIIEKTEINEKPELSKQTISNKTITKSEGLDTDNIANLIKQYQSIN